MNEKPFPFPPRPEDEVERERLANMEAYEEARQDGYTKAFKVAYGPAYDEALKLAREKNQPLKVTDPNGYSKLYEAAMREVQREAIEDARTKAFGDAVEQAKKEAEVDQLLRQENFKKGY